MRLLSLEPPDRQRVDAQMRLHAIVRRAQAAAPYFAHVRVRTGRAAPRDVLFGLHALALDGASVVDWRTSRFTEVLIGCDEGDEWQLAIEGRRLRGTLVEKNLLRFEAAQLVEVAGPETVLSRRGDDDDWSAGPVHRVVELLARPEAMRERSVALVDVALDRAQQSIVTLPADRSLLLLGEAGHGKTTVALHRLAWLRTQSPARMKAAVIVPAEGLRRLVDTALARLGIHDVDAWVYDRFAARQARWAFPGIPRRESEGATSGVVWLKRHAALQAVLAELVAEEPLPDDEGAARKRKRGAVSPPTRRDALLHLFGDRRWMERVVARAEGTLPASIVPQVLEHTHVQFLDTAEKEFAHVEADRLKTVDGRSIDEGTSSGDAGTIDPEDYAVLFELDRLRAQHHRANPRQPRRYDCLVIDEAQELAPAELALLGRSVKPGGTILVAGDADQQVDPAACFGGWDETLSSLGVQAHDRAVLAMSYRCPPGVTATARAILHGGAASLLDDGTVAFPQFPDDCHLLAWLADELRRLRDADPAASVAVIARTPEHARLVAAGLRRGLGVRLALEGDFGARAGTKVTCVREVKGLEFDHVIVPDASLAVYPDTPDGRRALYVAATRAIHQLVLATGGPWSPIVEAVLSAPRRPSGVGFRASSVPP